MYGRLNCMKNALRNKKIYLFAGLLSILGIGLPFLILVITLNVENAAPFYYPAMLGAFAAVYLLVGYVWGDLKVVFYRRKNREWDSPLPEEVKTDCWLRRWPFFFACILTAIVFLIFEIIYWVSGGYPFL